jgi:nicotinate-nucleotide adenylyltransferase
VRSLGVLGGTFNPPHLGHLALARHARAELGLERVLLMPEHRLQMCRLAVADAHGVEACGLEVERGGASYTVDTLQAIHAICPDARLTFVVGADTARTLDSWREPARLLELAGLAVAMRSGTERGQVLETVASIPGGEREEVRFLEMEPMEVSSSLARERVARSQPIADLVGESVAGYIVEHGLYGAPVEVAG